MVLKNDVKPIQSVSHAMQLFEVFRLNTEKDEFGVTELSKILGLHKNNVFRLLATLSSCGYIEQNPATENYRLGIGVFNLGQQYITKLEFLKLARPFLEKIVSEVNESVYIGIMREKTIIYLDMVDSNHSVCLTSRIGKAVPAYCTAIGKVQLAYLPEDEIIKSYSGVKIKKYAENTITNFTELKKNLKEISENDFAIDDQEFEKDVRCIAVPIKDYQGVPAAAISAAGPIYRMSEKRMKNDILPVLKKYAKEISKRLGY